jgi:hypothetical protein
MCGLGLPVPNERRCGLTDSGAEETPLVTMLFAGEAANRPRSSADAEKNEEEVKRAIVRFAHHLVGCDERALGLLQLVDARVDQLPEKHA